MINMQKFRKIIYALLLGCFVTWVIAFAWLHLSYASNLPDAPDTKTGRIFRVEVNHDFVRYGSEREIHTLRWVENSQPIAIVCFLIALIVGLRSAI
jgi:ABC-type glycerol-3-phosphate transport system permease component